MGKKKRRNQFSFARRTIAGLPLKGRWIRLDDEEEYYEDDEDDGMGHHVNSVHIFEQNNRNPEFTGILTHDARPIFRFFMPKPGMGFNVEGIEDFEPHAFMYGTHPEYDSLQEQEEDYQAEDED